MRAGEKYMVSEMDSIFSSKSYNVSMSFCFGVFLGP